MLLPVDDDGGVVHLSVALVVGLAHGDAVAEALEVADELGDLRRVGVEQARRLDRADHGLLAAVDYVADGVGYIAVGVAQKVVVERVALAVVVDVARGELDGELRAPELGVGSDARVGAADGVLHRPVQGGLRERVVGGHLALGVGLGHELLCFLRADHIEHVGHVGAPSVSLRLR